MEIAGHKGGRQCLKILMEIVIVDGQGGGIGRSI